MSIEFFNVLYRPGLNEAPLHLLCQAVDVGGEKLLWLDGVDPDRAVMVSISAVRELKWAGSFDELCAARADLAGQVLEHGEGEYSPTILARAMLYMSRDTQLSCDEALEMAQEQGLGILRADEESLRQFGAARQRLPN
jgi:hypothetical protein